jgi:uncharacterized repeat protein (TIGR01451 family)
MATDTASGRVVLFGGLGETPGYLNDTWTWDGTNWTLEHPVTSPPARIAAAMATDPVTGHVVLFAGAHDDGIQNDTWTWTGANWVQQHPVTSPPAGLGHAMAGDPVSGKVVVFGIYGSAPGVSGETWTWDGTNWSQEHPLNSPSPRDDAAMATDPQTGHVALFGGNALNGAGTITVGDTWTWDGTTWTQQAPATSPPPREVAAMAAEPAAGRMVLFGGGGGTGPAFLGDTWTLTISGAPDRADLGVTLGAPRSAASGSTITYVVTVTNHGPGPATDVRTLLAVPAGVRITTIDGGGTRFFGLVSWRTPTVHPGERVTFRVVGTVGQHPPGTLVSFAVATSKTPDPHRIDNVALAFTRVP